MKKRFAFVAALAVAAVLAMAGCSGETAKDYSHWTYTDWSVASEEDRIDCTIAFVTAVDPDGMAQMDEEERRTSAQAMMPAVEQMLQSDQSTTISGFIQKANADTLYTTQTPPPVLPEPISVEGTWTLQTIAGKDVPYDENNCTRAEFHDGTYRLIEVKNGVPLTTEEGTYVEENAMLTLTVDGEEKTATVTGQILAMEFEDGRAATFTK